MYLKKYSSKNMIQKLRMILLFIILLNKIQYWIVYIRRTDVLCIISLPLSTIHNI